MTTTVSPTKSWLAAMRPRTLGAAVAPIAVGSALAHAEGALALDLAFTTLAVALLLQIGANFYNDYGDHLRGADTAERLGPARAAASGLIAPRALRRASFAALGLAAAIGLWLVARGGWPFLLLGAGGIAAGVLYTGGPRPLGYLGLGEVLVLSFFGFAGVAGSYYLHTGRVSAAALWCALAVGSLASAMLAVNNLRDRHGDARADKRTLVVRFGERFGRLEYAFFVVVAYAIPLGLAAGRAGALLPLLSLPLGIAALWRVWRRDGAALNRELAATARLQLVYSALLAFGLAW
jgi:1,4-dihydroxy-2-naphthoate octaprenyltransferase